MSRKNIIPELSSSSIVGAVSALLGMAAMPSIAWADCTSSNGQNYVCSGTTTVPQAIVGSNLIVDASSTYDSNIATGGAVALGVRNDAGDVQVVFSGKAKNGQPTVYENIGNSGPLSIRQNGTGKLTLDQKAGSLNDGVTGGIAVHNFSGSFADVVVSGEMTASLNSAGLYYQGNPNLKIIQNSGGQISGLQTAMGIWILAGNPASSATDSIYLETAGEVKSDQSAIYGSITSNGGTISNQVGGNAIGKENGIYWEKKGATGGIQITSASYVEGTNNAGVQVAQQDTTNTETTTVIQKAGRIVGGQGILVANANSTSGRTLIDVAGVVQATKTLPFRDVISSTKVRVGTTLPTIVDTTTEYIADPSLPAAISPKAVKGNSEIYLRAGAHAVAAMPGLAIRGYGSNDKVLLEPGSKTSGGIALGAGNDLLTIQGNADITEVNLLDGGNSAYTEVTVVTARNFNGTVVISGPTTTNNSDILGTATAATNKLIFDGTSQSLAGSIMKNWQSVNLNASQVSFSGDAAIITGTGTNPDSSLQGLVLQSSTLASPVSLAVTGDVNIDASSTLRHTLGGSITGAVTNAGSIYWGNLNQTLQIIGNYAGGSGSTMSLETQLGDDSSPTDSLHVTGSTSGTTTITIRVAPGSLGAATTNGILIARVDGSSNGNFVLAGGTVTAGNYAYSLNKVGNNWYLQSTLAPIQTPEISVTCAPAMLSDSAGQVSTCTVSSSSSAPQGGIAVNLNLPANNPRYSTTCASSILIAEGTNFATCTIVATPNTVAGDGNAIAALAVAPATVNGAYSPGGTPVQVTIQDDDGTIVGAPNPVPTIGGWTLFGLASLVAMFGSSCLRRRHG